MVMEPSWQTSTLPSSVRLLHIMQIMADDEVVETADKVNGKKYKQVFSQNMTKKGVPKVSRHVRTSTDDQITENPKDEEWTKITFTPELVRFGMSGIDDDTYALMMKRVYDIAGTVRDVKVFLNSERLKVKNFKQVS